MEGNEVPEERKAVDLLYALITEGPLAVGPTRNEGALRLHIVGVGGVIDTKADVWELQRSICLGLDSEYIPLRTRG